MKWRNTLILIGLIFSMGHVHSQELRANVTINTPILSKADPKVFLTLESQIEEFYNNTSFTQDAYEEDERIGMEITMTLSEEITDSRFKADFAIQSTRPVYYSNYETPTFTHVDKDFAFDYVQFTPIDFSENTFTSNLSSLLTFYAYIILGLDADSFAQLGGTNLLYEAQNVVNNIPPSLNDYFKNGWTSIQGNRNRFWLIDNLLSARVIEFRQSWYDYHRHGLDIMHEQPDAGRAIINNSISTLSSVNRDLPNSMILQVFSNTKNTELVEIFKNGTPEEKNNLINVMTKVDPANSGKYRKVK